MGGDIVVGFIDAKFRAAFIRTLTVDGIVSLGYYTCLYVLYLSLESALLYGFVNQILDFTPVLLLQPC